MSVLQILNTFICLFDKNLDLQSAREPEKGSVGTSSVSSVLDKDVLPLNSHLKLAQITKQVLKQNIRIFQNSLLEIESYGISNTRKNQIILDFVVL